MKTSFFVTVHCSGTSRLRNLDPNCKLDEILWPMADWGHLYSIHLPPSKNHELVYINDINLETIWFFPCSTWPRIVKRAALLRTSVQRTGSVSLVTWHYLGIEIPTGLTTPVIWTANYWEPAGLDTLCRIDTRWYYQLIMDETTCA